MDSRADTAEKLFQMSFLFHNKMMRPVLHNSKSILSPLQIHVLKTLKENVTATMTFVANEIKMSKQQTTRVVDHLVSQGFVRRDFEKQDRRIIKISLTATGEAELDNIKEEAIEHMAASLASLDERSLSEFDEAAGKLTRLFKKLP